jgi:hypothetical protein
MRTYNLFQLPRSGRPKCILSLKRVNKIFLYKGEEGTLEDQNRNCCSPNAKSQQFPFLTNAKGFSSYS